MPTVRAYGLKKGDRVYYERHIHGEFEVLETQYNFDNNCVLLKNVETGETTTGVAEWCVKKE